MDISNDEIRLLAGKIDHLTTQLDLLASNMSVMTRQLRILAELVDSGIQLSNWPAHPLAATLEALEVRTSTIEQALVQYARGGLESAHRTARDLDNTD